MKSYKKQQFLLGVAIALISSAIQANPFQLGDLERNSNGISQFDETEAGFLCPRSRLPTARELAIEATKYGANILELNQVLSDKVPDGFYLLKTSNRGKIDQFYYSAENYDRPKDKAENNLWSSSYISSTYHNSSYIYDIDGRKFDRAYTSTEKKEQSSLPNNEGMIRGQSHLVYFNGNSGHFDHVSFEKNTPAARCVR